MTVRPVLEAEAHRSLFNVIDLASGWKVDLIVRKRRPFSETEFGPRLPAEILGLAVWVATVEDVLVSKLEWAKLGGSAGQIDDAAELLRLKGPEIDCAYVERWVGELDLRQEWTAAMAAAAG